MKILNENKLNRIINKCVDRYLIESMGVPNDAIGESKDIVNIFLENVEEMYETVINLEKKYPYDEEDDSWLFFRRNTDWEDEFEFEFYTEGMHMTYRIYVFYDSLSDTKANTDCNGIITINFAPIKNIIDDIYERCSKNDTGKYDITNWRKEYVIMSVRKYLYPIILHELTHDVDEDGGKQDYMWTTNYHHLNKDDLKEVLYFFSDQEINARVSSSYALMESYLEEMMVDPQMLLNKEITTQEIQDMIHDVIKENDNELHSSYMETLLGIIKRSGDFSERHVLQRAEREKFRPYSLAYDLFNNDSRLKNNRKLKLLFSQNFKAGCKYVYDFYVNILERYKSRIMRTCIKAVQDYMVGTHEY